MIKYPKAHKNTPGFGYWGNFGEIEMGFSSGSITDNATYPGEKLHYHTKGTMYFLILEGSGRVEVEGRVVIMQKDFLYRIDPGEKYRVLGAETLPFNWLCICTAKDPSEKVVI